MLAAIRDAHVKDMGGAVCGSYSRSPTQELTSDMKCTDTLGAILKGKGCLCALSSMRPFTIINIPWCHFKLNNFETYLTTSNWQYQEAHLICMDR